MTYFEPKYIAKEAKEFCGKPTYGYRSAFIFYCWSWKSWSLPQWWWTGQFWVSTVYKADETEEGGRRKIVRLHCNWVIKQNKMPVSSVSSLRCFIKKHVLCFLAFNHIFKTRFCPLLCFSWLANPEVSQANFPNVRHTEKRILAVRVESWLLLPGTDCLEGHLHPPLTGKSKGPTKWECLLYSLLSMNVSISNYFGD